MNIETAQQIHLRAVHILRIVPDEFTVEWLTDRETWTRQPHRAGNFAHLEEHEVDAIALRNHGAIPRDCREALRHAPRHREFALPHSSL